jgi:hypothetical protein
MLFFSLDIPVVARRTGGHSEYPWLSATELRYTKGLLSQARENLFWAKWQFDGPYVLGNRSNRYRMLKKLVQQGRRQVEPGGVPSGVR